MHIDLIERELDSAQELQVELKDETDVFWMTRADLEKMAAAFGCKVVAL